MVVANAAIAYRLRPRLGAQMPSSPLLERYRETAGVQIRLGAGRDRRRPGLFAGGAASGQVLELSGLAEAQPVQRHRPEVRARRVVLRLRLSVVAVRAVVRLRRAGLQCCRGRHRALHDGWLRFSGPRRGGSRAAQAQLSILVGLAVLVRASGTGSTSMRLEIERSNRLFTGISYTADHATIDAKMILAIIAGICALLFFANAVIRRWIVPTIGLILLLLSAIVLGLVYPGAVQYFSVRPERAGQGSSYITANIAATRAAYGVDKVEITDYSAKTTATAGQLKSDAEALPGIRLIDPNVVGPAYEQLQQVRGYYTFPKILDVDRYTIDGKETDAVVAVREMDLSGVEDNWNNLKTVYTHGYGLVAAYGNRRQPAVNRSGSPRTSRPTGEIDEHEPRIYFGEMQGSGPISTPSSARRPVRRRSSWTRLAVAKVATRRPTPTPARVGSVSATCGTGCFTPRSSPTSTSCSRTALTRHPRSSMTERHGNGCKAPRLGSRLMATHIRPSSRGGSSGSLTATQPRTPTRTASV